MLEWFHQKGFISILVYFNIPDEILHSRIENSQRSTAIFRVASSFDKVLRRQITDSQNGLALPPTESESEYLFVVNDSNEVPCIIQKIVHIAQNL